MTLAATAAAVSIVLLPGSFLVFSSVSNVTTFSFTMTFDILVAVAVADVVELSPLLLLNVNNKLDSFEFGGAVS